MLSEQGQTQDGHDGYDEQLIDGRQSRLHTVVTWHVVSIKKNNPHAHIDKYRFVHRHRFSAKQLKEDF